MAYLIALVMTAGCASTTVSDRQQLVSGYLPRPAQIWVYDFAATPADVPPESALAGQSSADAAPLTAQQIAEGRKLGAEIAAELVQQIQGMGMPAATALAATRPQRNDLVIEGALLSVLQGSAGERVSIGFGVGGSELKAAVEGFQMTTTGLRKLGSGELNATGNKTPGAAAGLAALIATRTHHQRRDEVVRRGKRQRYGSRQGPADRKDFAAALKKRFQQEGWISAS